MYVAFYFFALICLSQSSNWVKWAQAPVEQLGFGRLFVASFLIWAWQSYRGEFKKYLWNKRKSLVWALLSALLFFLHLWTYKASALQTKISNQMILFASNPLWTAALSLLFLKERFHPRLVLSYAFSLAGLFLLLSHQIEFESHTLRGDGLALLYALLFSLYILATRKAREQMSNGQFTFILFSVSGIGFGLVCWAHQTALIPESPRAWAAVFGLAVFSTLLGHGVFAWLLGKMNINWMSCGKLLEPVLASLMAQFLFGEQLNLNQILSFTLTAIGVTILFLKPMKKAGASV